MEQKEGISRSARSLNHRVTFRRRTVVSAAMFSCAELTHHRTAGFTLEILPHWPFELEEIFPSLLHHKNTKTSSHYYQSLRHLKQSIGYLESIRLCLAALGRMESEQDSITRWNRRYAGEDGMVKQDIRKRQAPIAHIIYCEERHKT